MKTTFGVIAAPTAVTSTNAVKLAKQAVTVITDIKSLEVSFMSLVSTAQEFGITRKTGDQAESDIQFLSRVAKEANIKAHEIACEEDVTKVEKLIAGEVIPRRKGLAGWLDKAADRVAAI